MQVAECYIHVRYARLGRQEFEHLRELLLSAASELARDVKRGREIDFTFEEGTLLQRIVVIGALGLSAVSSIAQYHNFRLSVIEMEKDAETFGSYAIDQFRKLTHTTPANDIYKRTTSRDLNRLSRIISRFDELATSHAPSSELAQIRRSVIQDLAGLARANPDDPDIAKLLHLLPRGPIPNLPDTPGDAIWMDDKELRRRKSADRGRELLSARGPIEEARQTPRLRFHTRVKII